MPATLSYPGVYIEEIPSGVRTITGVATSITAFIGRTSKGPLNEPTEINNFGDFERQFGGLASDYPMSYAVRDFYSNQGNRAIIVRLYKAPAPAGGGGAPAGGGGAPAGGGGAPAGGGGAPAGGGGAPAGGGGAPAAGGGAPAGGGVAPAEAVDGAARFTVDDLKLVASSPGEWGKKLRATIDLDVSGETRTRLGIGKDDFLFNLTIRDSNPGGSTEYFRNLTIVDSSRRVDKVLEAESSLVRYDGKFPKETADRPKLPNVKAASDKLAALQTELGKAPPDPAKIKTAQEAYDKAKKDLDDNATKAEKQLAEALKATPPVPDDINKAQKALADAEETTKAQKSDALGQTEYQGNKDQKTGIFALDKADLFNLLCIPPDTRDGDTPAAVYQSAMSYCQQRRAMLVVDSPAAWSANKDTAAAAAKKGLPDLGLSGDAARNAALYFPRVLQADPLSNGQIDTFVPCGIIAGVMARTDTSRGVWKAPAGLDAAVNGVQGLQVNLNDDENGLLNPLGINCLRSFPVNGRVVWGARTMRGADQLADEWKYVSVRRTALFIEESLYRGTQWVVFEPNDEPLWAQIRLNVGAFMNNLFRQGAFQGTTPKDAYFVKCDKETTTQNDVNLGIVNIVVGFAPLKPAEFVVIKLQQMAGQIQT
jgi:uncharacterized protein